VWRRNTYIYKMKNKNKNLIYIYESGASSMCGGGIHTHAGVHT
jgi:hypothetical protein